MIGVPGTFQGLEHAKPTENKSDPKIRFGAEVATVVAGLRQKVQFDDIAIGYPAVGARWDHAIDARLIYDVSQYKWSKDAGYSTAYNALKDRAAKCATAKFVLVGYSQGAHIVGDLAQSVFHGNGPINRSRITAVILLADPAYNGPSPRTTEAIYSDNKLTQDQDHWKIGGGLGQRAYFTNNDPVVSVCVYGDPVCDGADLGGQDGKFKAWSNQSMHGLYLGQKFEGERDFATWTAVQAARLITPGSAPNAPSPPATSSPAGPTTTPPTPAPVPAPQQVAESVTISQAGARSVSVTVTEAGGAGERAIRCWNATDATHKWAENYLGETKVTIPRTGTFTVNCPTAPKAGTFSLEFFNWRWSPAIQWR
ncbi:cutinase family protein [Nocardia sp. PE-7]|uniref:cutinase family protein n=1 Tax=Nocardia sp. PE-7 TaxID=3058426 RepID=UPI002659B022|nr:cutinase family protein [Nocardia sp. PE-7]WKG12433.1 cutinase family protein [Nocardia sp. PE-7]